jgi:hypothetical protein
MTAIALRIALCLALASAAGCRGTFTRMLPTLPFRDTGITEEELLEEVLRAENRFAISVSTAADEIAQQSTDRTVRRRALLWKVRMIPLAQRAALAPLPTEGLVQLLALSSAQRAYLTDGAGRDLFGAQQETASSAAVVIDEDLRALTERILPPEQAQRLLGEVGEATRESPIRGEFALEAARSGLAKLSREGKLNWFVRAPMAPFRALEGVETGAQAIHEFNATARQFSDLVAVLPEQTRWQLELFLYDLEDRESVDRALAVSESMAESAERLSLAAERFPEATRRELVALLDESAAGQAELRQTLTSLREAFASADAALQNARPLAESLERIAANVDAAGKSWAGVVEALRREDERPPDPNARPFDILDYERTASQIGTAAGELRTLIADVRGGGPAGSLLDALLWRALAFVAGAFALLLVYRVLAGLVARGTIR